MAHVSNRRDTRPGLDPALTVAGVLPVLLNRRSECEELDRLVADLRTGKSRALVLWGDVGIGKSVLLDHTLEQAGGCRAIRAAGVEGERQLAFAALHQLCVPMLAELDLLPVPQRDALRTAF